MELTVVINPESTAQLLDLYAREADPVTKGLLAVVLSADYQARELILEDLTGPAGKTSEHFRALALFALVKLPFWQQRYGLREYYWESLIAMVEHQLLESPRAGSVPSWRGVEGSHDERIRHLLLTWPESDSRWILDLVEQGIAGSANHDPVFAGRLLRPALECGDPGHLGDTLHLLQCAQLEPAELARIDNLARQSSDERVFQECIYILRNQKESAVQSMRNLFELLQSDSTRQTLVVQAIQWCIPTDSFEDVALRSLESPHADLRKQALGLLATGKWQGSAERILEALRKDPDRGVRLKALQMIGLAKEFTAQEKSELERVSVSDPDANLREYAYRLIHPVQVRLKETEDGSFEVEFY